MTSHKSLPFSSIYVTNALFYHVHFILYLQLSRSTGCFMRIDWLRIDITFLSEKIINFWKKVLIDLEVQFFSVTNFLCLRFQICPLCKFEENNHIQPLIFNQENYGKKIKKTNYLFVSTSASKQWEKHSKIHNHFEALWKIFQMRPCWLSIYLEMA